MEQAFEDLNLSNFAEGELESVFQECLADVAAVIGEPDRFELTKDGVLVTHINLELQIACVPGEAALSLSCRGDIKRPKHRLKTGRPGFYVQGVFTTPRFKQAELFTHKKTQ